MNSSILIPLHVRICNLVKLTAISTLRSVSDETGLKLCVFDLKADNPFNHRLWIP